MSLYSQEGDMKSPNRNSSRSYWVNEVNQSPGRLWQGRNDQNGHRKGSLIQELSLFPQHCWGERGGGELGQWVTLSHCLGCTSLPGKGGRRLHGQIPAATSPVYILDHLVGIFCIKHELTGLTVDMSIFQFWLRGSSKRNTSRCSNESFFVLKSPRADWGLATVLSPRRPALPAREPLGDITSFSLTETNWSKTRDTCEPMREKELIFSQYLKPELQHQHLIFFFTWFLTISQKAVIFQYYLENRLPKVRVSEGFPWIRVWRNTCKQESMLEEECSWMDITKPSRAISMEYFPRKWKKIPCLPLGVMLSLEGQAF